MFFFFSSRRRHTRWPRDWSSDVCSSDLAKEISDEHLEELCESGTDAIIVGGTDNITLDAVLDLLYRIRRRSEERRVGKECRFRWSSYDYKTKNDKKRDR